MKAGVHHSLFLCGKSGFVYHCGGLRKSTKTFDEILISEPVQHISASLHSAALSFSGKMYLWGDDVSIVDGPIISENPHLKAPLKQICLSRSFCVVQDQNNRTFMWGLDGNNVFRALNNKYVK
jgi:hypothetical protein